MELTKEEEDLIKRMRAEKKESQSREQVLAEKIRNFAKYWNDSEVKNDNVGFKKSLYNLYSEMKPEIIEYYKIIEKEYAEKFVTGLKDFFEGFMS